MASISREFSVECFDFDHLYASCLGGLVLKHEQKEAASRLLERKRCFGVSFNWFWQEFNISKFCFGEGNG